MFLEWKEKKNGNIYMVYINIYLQNPLDDAHINGFRFYPSNHLCVFKGPTTERLIFCCLILLFLFVERQPNTQTTKNEDKKADFL